MKKQIFIIAFLLVGMAGFGQSIWKPVPANLFTSIAKAGITTSTQTTWLPRFSLGVQTQQFYIENNGIVQSTRISTGVGLSAAHFTADANGVPINDFTATAMVLFPLANPLQGITAGVVVSALKFASLSPGIGLGYDSGIKKAVVFFNAIFTFN